MNIFFFPNNNPIDEVQNFLLMSLAVALVIRYVQFLWKRRYMYIHSWNVEGPLAFPIIGCAYLFMGNGTEILHTLMKLLQNMKSGILKIWLGPKLYYFISEPEHVETVLNHSKALGKESVYNFMAEGIGYGLLTAPVPKWKHHRKLLAPSFNQKILDSFVEVFAEKSKIFAEELKTVVGQKNVDLYQFSARLTLDIICQTAMGVNMNIQKEKGTFGTVLETVLEVLNYRIFRIWHHLDFIWQFSPLRVSYEKCKAEFHYVTGSVITKKMAEHQETLRLKQHCLDAEIEEEPTYERLAFLDLILKNPGFTELDLQEEVNIFLAAGTETTATSICCLFTMLGLHQEVQQKVYEEVIDLLGPDRTVEASDLPKMKYTERVIKENLRLFPIAALFSRAIEEDIVLGDVILPAGSAAVFGTVFIHRNPKYWTDPLKFDPDRFLPGEVAKRHPCTYIPFSYGPRNCIGWRYSIANIKVVIATVIRQYRIFTEYKSVEEIQMKLNLLMRLSEGSKVWLEYR